MIGLRGNQSTTRALNRRLVLDALRRQGPISRVGLTQMTGLSPSAISGVISELIVDGFVLETGVEKSKGGRKPVSLGINYGGHRSLGIKLMDDRMQVTLTDLATRPLSTHMVELPEVTPEAVAHETLESLSVLLPDPDDRRLLVGVGIAMPGFIDANTGVCINSHRLGWVDVPIGPIVSEAVNAPVWVDNDVKAYAVAHHLFGLGRQHSSILVFIVGTGLGAALLVDDRVFRGAHFRAGEIGFATEFGPAVVDGVWNGRYSQPGLIAEWRAMRPGTDLQECAEAGDDDALALFHARGTEIGTKLNTLIQFLDPELVIVGGETMAFGPAFFEPLRQAALDTVPHPRPELTIDRQNDIWGQAAAALAMQTIFNFESQTATV